MKRLTALLCSFCIVVSLFSGCTGKKADGSFPEEESSAVMSVTSESAAASKAPTETSDQTSSDIEETESLVVPLSETSELSEESSVDLDQPKAVKLAEQHGLAEDDLDGQYALFLKYSETIEGNSELGDYREYVYRIFPVVADNVEYLDEEYFFNMLSTLNIRVTEIDEQFAALYEETNEILISERCFQDLNWQLSYVVFHELMHFLDASINGLKDSPVILNGEHLRYSEFEALPVEQIDGAIYCDYLYVMLEGGAEYYQTKYFSGAPSAYKSIIDFMAGIEYIMGEDYLNRLFFSWDTDAIFKELLLDAGYSETKYRLRIELLDRITRTYKYEDEEEKEFTYSVCDILIELYEHYKDGDWKEDKAFLAILRNLNGIGIKNCKNSKYADFLSTIVLQNEEQFNKYKKAFVKGIPEKPKFESDYPRMFMRDGKLYQGVIADLTDPQTGEKYKASIIYEWDYENDERISYEIKRLDPMVDYQLGSESEDAA